MIFRGYYGRLVRFLTRYLRTKDAAEDVAQEVFVRLWERRTEIDPDRSLRAYLFTAARNRAMDLLEHEQVVQRYAGEGANDALGSSQPGTPAADADLLAQELAEVAAVAVANLSPRMREIYHLSRDEGLSAAEIAEALGITTQTVYVQLGKIIRALYPSLRPWVDER